MRNKGKMDKEKPQPTNVRPIVKDFLFNQKAVLKQRFGKFVSEEGVLMYYLNGNEEFVKDFGEYSAMQNKKEDLLQVLTNQ